MVQLDIDTLNETCEQKFLKIDHVERVVDKIERSMQRATLRVFGLKENVESEAMLCCLS